VAAIDPIHSHGRFTGDNRKGSASDQNVQISTVAPTLTLLAYLLDLASGWAAHFRPLIGLLQGTAGNFVDLFRRFSAESLSLHYAVLHFKPSLVEHFRARELFELLVEVRMQTLLRER